MKKLLIIFVSLVYISTVMAEEPYDSLGQHVNSLNVNADSKSLMQGMLSCAQSVTNNPLTIFTSSIDQMLALHVKLQTIANREGTSEADRTRIEQQMRPLIHQHSQALWKVGVGVQIRVDDAHIDTNNCTVRITVRSGNTSFPRKKIYIERYEFLNLFATGSPSGGTYEWEVKELDRAGIRTDGPNATYMSEKKSTVRIIVTYTTPPPTKQCQDTIEVIIF